MHAYTPGILVYFADLQKYFPLILKKSIYLISKLTGVLEKLLYLSGSEVVYYTLAVFSPAVIVVLCVHQGLYVTLLPTHC